MMRLSSSKELEAQGLRDYIIEALGSLDLNLDHQTRLDDAVKSTAGDFIPRDIELGLIDIKMWVIDEEIDKLIALAKKLPTVKKGSAVLFFIDGARVCSADYFNGDNIKGKRQIKGLVISKEEYENMMEEEYRKTRFSGTRLGEIKSVQVFGTGYAILNQLVKSLA